MATLELADIMDRVRAVLEASPFSYTASTDPFSHDRDPNSVIGTTYALEDGGFQSQRPQTNYKAARIDRVTVWLARQLRFAPHAQLESLEDDLLKVERYLKADGRTQGYHVEIAGRRVSRRPDSDILVGSLTITVDYDVNEATS